MKMFYLQLRNELWKLFGKKRTYIGFGAFFIAEIALALLFRYNHGVRNFVIRPLERFGYTSDEVLSSLTIAVTMLFPIANLLMPLYVSLVGGDLMAKEAEDGTLRMILSRPISRLRLLGIKWVAGAIFSTVLIFALAGFAILLTTIFFSQGGLYVVAPWEGIMSVFSPGAGWERFLLADFFLVLNAISIMSLALMLSCFNMKPAAAAIVAISVVLLNLILQDMPALADLKEWFITYYFRAWLNCYREIIPWWKIGEACCMLFGFNLTFFIIGCTAFQTRDIKS
jgi:ABC-2 type transport system permease protein